MQLRNVVILNTFCALLAAALTLPAAAQTWQQPEDHPNPIWARPWVSLNGPWSFRFDEEDAGLEQQWWRTGEYDRTIEVPFPWQSQLSGIGATDYQGAAWYQRTVAVPADAGPRIFLVFGAVDWTASVWVNGREAGSHTGGYTPFEFDITDYVTPGQSARITVRAVDNTGPETPNGKQTGWYTPTGGIWQTVYLESRGASYLSKARAYPDIDRECVRYVFDVQAAQAGEYEVTVNARCGARCGGREHAAHAKAMLESGANEMKVTLPVPDPALWSPDSPALYMARVELKAGEDTIDTAHTYFGMRKVSRGTYNGSEHEYILLNNKPVYLRGALHQSFNPEGVYTHPNDAFIRADYELAKRLGLNMLRIHIKTEEPRCLYWADRLGILIMADVPNYWKHSDRAKRLWEATMRAQIARDFNHPSIFSLVCFNETWGIGDGGYGPERQEWVRDMYLLAKQLDPSWLIEDNSPCRYDHVVTDINSWHFYIDRYERARDHIAEVVEKTYPGSTFNYAEGWKQDTAPLINSEYGGVSAGSGDRDISWVFLHLTNLLRKHGKICGYVYTELSDIEWEHNGFVNYDRRPKAYHYPAGITVSHLQQAEFPVLDCPPYQRVEPGQRVSIPVLLSHWSEREGLVLRFSAHGASVEGTPWSTSIGVAERPVTEAEPFKVSPQGSYDITMPEGRGLIFVAADVMDGAERLASNYCVLDLRGQAWAGPREYAAPFPAGALSDITFATDEAPRELKHDKVSGFGTGYMEYTLRLPEGLAPEAVESCRFVGEMSARASTERLDWPARRKSGDYPQTDEPAWPTDIVFSLNGREFGQVTINNDFADARGVLSHVAHYHHGSNGPLLDVPIAGGAFDALKKALADNREVTLRFEVPKDAAHPGGLAIYGEDMGAYPVNPSLVFTLTPGTAKPTGAVETVNTLESRWVTLLDHGPNGHLWRYTLEEPDEGWVKRRFDDDDWEKGRAGFGTPGTPGALIGTKWDTQDIWLRTELDMDRGLKDAQMVAQLHHDEDVEIYVNGGLLLERKGYRGDYETVILSEDQRGLFSFLRKNVIAIHCRQTRGGQFVDFGLAARE